PRRRSCRRPPRISIETRSWICSSGRCSPRPPARISKWPPCSATGWTSSGSLRVSRERLERRPQMRLEAFALPLVRLALTEDLGGGDVTTDGVVDEAASGRAHIEARHEGVLAGRELAELTFRELDPAAKVEWTVAEGGTLTKGAKFATITARARAILSGERVALNFLQHLSGVATLARAYAKAVEGTGVTILDTRKTTPGLRFLEKHAVRVGGAGN